MKRLRWGALGAAPLFVAAAVTLSEGALRVRQGPPAAEPAPPPRGESVSVVAEDGAVLRAWWVRAERPRGRCVVVMHGVADTRKSSLGLAAHFLGAGYHALLPDARGHGASGGDMISYGVRETGDTVRWLAWMRERGCEQLYGLGESMGGAMLLQALGSGGELRAVVAEGAFVDFREIAKERIAQRLPFGMALGRAVAAPVVGLAFGYVRVRYGMDLERASPRRGLEQSPAPVLLIHGLSDVNTDPEHSRRLAAARAGIELWMPPGIGHTGAWAHPEFARRVLSFVEAR